MVEEKDINLTNEYQEVPDDERDTSTDHMDVGEKVEESEKESRNPFSKGKKAAKKYEERLTVLEGQLNEFNDKYLRLFSEFDNYRKRTSKERLELLKTASEDTITSLLPVLDDFERAMAAMGKNGVTGVDVDGIKLIYNKLLGILTKKGLAPITAKGQPFDTDFHEALTIIPSPDEDMKGKVIDEIEKGYLLNGKVIRFARVVVGQ